MSEPTDLKQMVVFSQMDKVLHAKIKNAANALKYITENSAMRTQDADALNEILWHFYDIDTDGVLTYKKHNQV